MGATRTRRPERTSQMPVTSKVLAAEAIILRALAKDATGIWDVRSGRRILVAPNVLADAQRYALDQTDWCRWVSLCLRLVLGIRLMS